MSEERKHTIAVVGRPNVGKSSLFNALLGYRRTIVLDMPGTTMDAVSEKVRWSGDMPLYLTDSQGIFDEGDARVITSLMKKAEAVIFVVDALSGPTPFDRWIANLLHQTRKPVFLVINKIDGKRAQGAAEFSVLGFGEMVEVSVAHRRNISDIKEWCLKTVGYVPPAPRVKPEWFEEGDDEETEEAPVDDAGPDVMNLAIVGRPNTGKSTLMNRLCDEQVSRVSPIPHTTRDAVSCELETPQGLIRIVDTAGVRRPRSKKEQLEIFSIQASTRAIVAADVVFLLINCIETVSDQDMRLLNLVAREGKPTVVLLNFWDQLDGRARKNFLGDSDFGRYLSQFKTLPLSGLTGLNVQECFPMAFRLYKQSKRRVKTSKLNKIVERIVAKNPPPAMGKQNFNILYASQVRVEPPSFVFFMNRKGALPASYQKYLENNLRKALGYKSQPIRIFFRGDKEAREV